MKIILWCSSLFLTGLVEIHGAFFPTSSSSVMHLRAGSTPRAYECSLRKIIPTLDDFDESRTLKATECHTDIGAALEDLVPENLRNEECLLDDIQEMIATISSIATKVDEVVVRLALIRGQKCPKWHEDYVRMRLLKTYYGPGTEYVSPDDNLMRFINALHTLQGKDFFVYPSKIKRCGINDVLIIRGRKSKEEGFIPVLHRSPEEEDETQRRLLLSITIP